MGNGLSCNLIPNKDKNKNKNRKGGANTYRKKNSKIKNRPARSVAKPKRVVVKKKTRGVRVHRQSPQILGLLGQAVGNMAGGPVGGLVGQRVGQYLQDRISGMGEYHVNHNALMTDSLPPTFAGDDGGIHITHSEFVKTITGSVEFKNHTDEIAPAINAGNEELFPWLSRIAGGFDNFQFEGLVFEYKTSSGYAVSGDNPALGMVMMATQYDVIDPLFVDRRHMSNYKFCTTNSPAENGLHPVECKPSDLVLPRLYVEKNNVLRAPGDERFEKLGNFQLATVGMPSDDNVIGELWVSYKVKLSMPRLGPDFITKRFSGIGYAHNETDWFGTPLNGIIPAGDVSFQPSPHNNMRVSFTPIDGGYSPGINPGPAIFTKISLPGGRFRVEIGVAHQKAHKLLQAAYPPVAVREDWGSRRVAFMPFSEGWNQGVPPPFPSFIENASSYTVATSLCTGVDAPIVTDESGTYNANFDNMWTDTLEVDIDEEGGYIVAPSTYNFLHGPNSDPYLTWIDIIQVPSGYTHFTGVPKTVFSERKGVSYCNMDVPNDPFLLVEPSSLSKEPENDVKVPDPTSDPVDEKKVQSLASKFGYVTLASYSSSK